MFGMFSQSPQIECVEARDLIQNNDAQLVDVRTPQECIQGSLPGSVNIPLQQIHNEHGSLDKSKPVIVFCASGGRSAQAQSLLRDLGFDQVHNLGSAQKYLTC